MLQITNMSTISKSIRVLPIILASLFLFGSVDAYFSSQPLHMQQERELTSLANFGFWRTALHGKIDAEGLVVDINDELDVDPATTLFVDGTFGFRNKWKFNLGYSGLSHTGNLETTVTLNNIDFAAEAKLDLKISMFEFGFYRDVYSTPDSNLDIGLGAKLARTDIGVSGTETGTGVSASESYDVNLPIPHLGLNHRFRLSDQVWTVSSLKYFSFNSNDGKITMTDWNTGLAFILNPSEGGQETETEWSIGAGYRSFTLTGEVDDNELEFGYRGLWLAILARF